MKRFIGKLAVFVVLLLAVLTLFELGFRHRRNVFKGKFEGLSKCVSEVEVLALGHSHVNEGFAPRVMNHRAYNMAMGFQNVYFDSKTLESFIDGMDSLKCVVLSTSYFHFYNILPELGELRGEDLFNTVKYHLYWGIDSVGDSKIPRLDPKYNLEILNNPARAYIAMFRYYLSGEAWNAASVASWEDFEKYGYFGQDAVGTEAHLTETGEMDARAHTWGDLSRNNYEIYERMAKTCLAHNVKLAIVLFPCWHSYYDNFNDEQISDTRRMMQELADGYDNCFAIDFLEDDRFEAMDFQDATHLNRRGAGKLTGILEAKLDSLGVFD